MKTNCTREQEALGVLLRSDWFFEEMENGNYHSAYEFLEELRAELDAKDGYVQREDSEGLDLP